MTRRSLLLSVLLVAAMAWIHPWNDLYYRNTLLIGNHLPIAPLFVLTLMVLMVNPLLRILRPAWILSSRELLSLWCIVIVAMSVPGSAGLRYLYSMLAEVPYLTQSNALYRETVLANVPDWLFPSTNPASSVVQGFTFGDASGIPWRAWLKPIAVWGVFLACLFWLMFCLTAIFRRQWVEHERLSFPLVQFPIELCREPEPGRSYPHLFGFKAFWLAALIPVSVHGINGLARLVGSEAPIPIPHITDLDTYLSHIPGITWTPVMIYFSVIAVCFLLTLETTFSLWFFFIFLRTEHAIAGAQGVFYNGYGPFSTNQQLGGYVVFVGALLWHARRHLCRVARCAVRFRRGEGDEREMLSYPAAAWGLVLSVAGLTAWSAIAGGSILWAFLCCVIWTLALLGITRIIAQTGLLFVLCQFSGAYFVPHNLGVTHSIGVRPYASSVLSGQIMRDLREVMMPNAMNSMKAASQSALSPRRLAVGMGIAMVVAFLVASASQLRLGYLKGAINWEDTWTTRGVPAHLSRQITEAVRPVALQEGARLGLIIGLLLTAALTLLRSRYFWWPLSPIGVLGAGTYPMNHMWFSIFVAWLLKWAVMRYGGGRAYRRLRNAALGLLIGDAVIAGIWIIVGLAVGRRVYSVMPM